LKIHIKRRTTSYTLHSADANIHIQAALSISRDQLKGCLLLNIIPHLLSKVNTKSNEFLMNITDI